MTITLSAPTAQVSFPAGTQDGPWNFTLSGTNGDGSQYNNSFDTTQDSAPLPSDVTPGAVLTLVVSKNGVSSLASDPFTVPQPPVILTVPDATQKAVFTVS